MIPVSVTRLGLFCYVGMYSGQAGMVYMRRRFTERGAWSAAVRAYEASCQP